MNSFKEMLRGTYRKTPIKFRTYVNFLRGPGYFPSLREPSTFNEKLQARKTGWKSNLFTVCSDKFLVKDYVSSILGQDFLIPTIFSSKSIREDDLIELIARHNHIVAKTTHGSGSVFFLNKDSDEASITAAAELLNRDLGIDFGLMSGEPWYSKIEPRIIIENDISDPESSLRDYKFHVFNQADGSDPELVLQVDFDRQSQHTRNFYDREGRQLDFEIAYPRGPEEALDKCNQLEAMAEAAIKLASPFSYARIDLYDMHPSIKFGEITFAHGSGFERFKPGWRDDWMGSLWKLDPLE